MNNLKEKAYNNKSNFVVALDGPSASGKSLIGKILAKKFHMKYVQSSLVYRGLAYLCIKNNIPSNDILQIIKLSETNLLDSIKNVNLQQEEIGNFASKISVIPEIRENLNKYLINIIKITPRIIMEGRDIGTVVAKNADLKIFITADVNKRAMRRYKQLLNSEKKYMLSDVLELLNERDLRDISRKHAPLIASENAFVIDTSDLSPEEVISKITDYIELGGS